MSARIPVRAVIEQLLVQGLATRIWEGVANGKGWAVWIKMEEEGDKKDGATPVALAKEAAKVLKL